MPEGINNAGVVVGYYFTTSPRGATCGDKPCDKTVSHGFSWNGDFTTYDPPDVSTEDNPRTGTRLFDINNDNVMVGSYLYLDSEQVGVTPGFRALLSGEGFTTYSSRRSRPTGAGRQRRPRSTTAAPSQA